MHQGHKAIHVNWIEEILLSYFVWFFTLDSYRLMMILFASLDLTLIFGFLMGLKGICFHIHSDYVFFIRVGDIRFGKFHDNLKENSQHDAFYTSWRCLP